MLYKLSHYLIHTISFCYSDLFFLSFNVILFNFLEELFLETFLQQSFSLYNIIRRRERMEDSREFNLATSLMLFWLLSRSASHSFVSQSPQDCSYEQIEFRWSCICWRWGNERGSVTGVRMVFSFSLWMLFRCTKRNAIKFTTLCLRLFVWL